MIEVLENEKDSLKIEVDDITLVNLLHENIWKNDGFSGYSKQHPYLSKPVLTVKGSNPKKTLMAAADDIISDIKELRKQAKNL